MQNIYVPDDIWGVNQRTIESSYLLDTKNRLLKSGFASWVNDI